MSLFQARDWWTARVEGEEECGPGCLVVGNVDNEPGGADKIVVGGFEGILRVYCPKERDYVIEDLKLEHRLDEPILQLLIGQFLPGTTMQGLAVLHPRRVVVYQILAQGGVGAEANFFTLEQRYEHRLGTDGLHFTAYNMIKGPFGGVRGKDYLCVQSMDGQIAFFEHDHLAFTRQLDFCLVPGPLCYCKKTDAIITVDTAMNVVAYKYQMLAAASDSRPTGAGGASEGKEDGGRSGKRGSVITSTRKIKADWRANLGEHVLDMRVCRVSRSLASGQVDILVLGEHTLFCLQENGGIRTQKRLDYNPICLTTYPRTGKSTTEGGASDNIIVASHTEQLMVYRDTSLIWAARAVLQPVDFCVATFGGLDGYVVSLDAKGAVSISYMGTDPPTTAVTGADAKDLNYEEMDEEHRRLLATIKESQSEHRTEPRDKILLRAQVPVTLDAPREPGEDEDAPDAAAGVRLTVRLYVSYTGADKLSDVSINLLVPPCIIAKQRSAHIDTLAGGRTPLIIPLTFQPRASWIPDVLSVRVAAAYTTAAGEPRTAQCDIVLPLCLVCTLSPPLKHNTYKFTLDTNKPPPPLPALFDDMLQQPGLTEDAVGRITASAANVLTFQYYNGMDATILVSKSAGRYRVQSGSLQALWTVSSELVKRLSHHFGKSSGEGKSGEASEPFMIAYNEPLPLADFFACIDDHFQCREALNEAHSLLNDRAHQFRLIQKRLLVRFKDRNPAPLNNLDQLLHGTYNQLIDIGHQVERVQADLIEASNRLSCATHLLLLLMRFRFGLDDNNFEVLQAHLSPVVQDTQEQGWEEMTDSAMTHLLRTTLAKSQKETATVPQPLQFPADTSKLKKHITIVCDRLAKGARVYRAPRRRERGREKSSAPADAAAGGDGGDAGAGGAGRK